MRVGLVALLLGTLACTGCSVERTVTVQSDPPGALVWLNDQEIGRTPTTHTFKWYGTYDVELRKDGYQTVKTTGKVIAPWWQWVPFDFFAELTPGHHLDHHDLAYAMVPVSDEPVDAQRMVARGQQLESRLESGERTHPPDTQPSVAPPKKHHTTAHPSTTAPAPLAQSPVSPTTQPTEPVPDAATAPTLTPVAEPPSEPKPELNK